MKKEECDIIKDLLPSYVEKLTSEASNQWIENHIKECKNCEQIRDQMGEKEEKKEEETNQKIKYLKKINHTKRNTFLFVCFSIAIFAITLVILYQATGLPINLKELEIKVEPKEIRTIDSQSAIERREEGIHYQIQYLEEGSYITASYAIYPEDTEVVIKIYGKWGDGGKVITGEIPIKGKNRIYIEGAFGQKLLLWERK